MKKVEVTGKTIDQAISSGLKMLDTTIDKVNVEIISEPSLFKKAKVQLSIIEEEKPEKEEKEESVEDTTDTTQKTEEVLEKEVELEKPAKIQYTSSDIIMYVSKYLNHLIYLYNQIGEVEVKEEGKDFFAYIKGDDLSMFIGYHGEVLEAFQKIINATLQNKFDFRGRLFLDVQGYKDKRKNTLIALAKRMAKNVVANKKAYSLEPMNSYERRIIHTALQGVKNVSTHSEGEGKERHLIIDYVEE